MGARGVGAMLACLAAAACGHHDLGADATDGNASVDATVPSDARDAGDAGDARDGGDSGCDVADAASGRISLPYKSVVLCGDSQVGYGHGLTRALAEKFREAGVTKYRWDAFTSASVQSYDDSDRLTKLVASRKPDVVLITIGSNNVQNPHPEGLAGNVRSLARKAKAGDPSRDCYILGPPLPIKGVKKDTGIIRVLAENAAPCKFFDTSKLDLERQKDHIHPTDKGGEVWADALWQFMLDGADDAHPPGADMAP